jgi:hypothetical protein
MPNLWTPPSGGRAARLCQQRVAIAGSRRLSGRRQRLLRLRGRALLADAGGGV